jgi:hypothetical protein
MTIIRQQFSNATSAGLPLHFIGLGGYSADRATHSALFSRRNGILVAVQFGAIFRAVSVDSPRPGWGRLFGIRRATTPMAERADIRLRQITQGA